MRRIKIYLFLFGLALCSMLMAQTILSAGDLVFVTVNADGNKNFDFVPLIDIDANTVIYFSDNPWDGSELKNTEGTLKYTASAAVYAGTVVSYSGAISGDWTNEDAGFNPSGTGDNILAFQGSSSSPTFIAGVGWARGTTWISSGSTTTNNSYIPSALSTSNHSIISLSTKDNYQYDTSKGIIGTKSDLRYLLSQVDNYNSNSLSAYSALSTTFTVGQAISGDSGFRMLSSPVAGTTYDDLLAPLWTQGITNADVSSGDANVWIYDPVNSLFKAMTNLTTSTYTAGNGLLIYVFSDTNNDGVDDLPVYLNVSGTESTPTVSVSTTESAWNLLGNPYESTIDADQLFSDNTDFSSVVYVWDDANSQYQSWNGTTGGLTDGLIAPYQGFWVESNAGGTTYDFKSDCKTGTVGTFLKSRETRSGSLVIHVESEQGKASTYLSFSSDGYLALDIRDAFQLMPLDIKRHLAVMTFSDTTALQIQHLPNIWPGILSIPLEMVLLEPNAYGYVSIDAPIKMTWDISSLPKDIVAYLKNSNTDQYIKLVEGGSIEVQTRGVGTIPLRTGVSVYPKIDTPQYELMFVSTNMETDSETPNRFSLHPAFPNPFNGTTTLSFEIPKKGPVSIYIYNIRGEQVSHIINEPQLAGKQSIQWDPNPLPSGIYFCRMQFGQQSKTIKLLFMK